MDQLADWLKAQPFHDFMINVSWAVPACETLHFMGLTLLIGSLFVVDMRALGFFRAISFTEVHKLIWVAIFGFSINALTGIAFLFFDPDRYFANYGFRFKMLFVLLAGVNALAFEFLVYRQVRAGDVSAADGSLSKTIAALSLVFWFAVVILGRFMPYVEF